MKTVTLTINNSAMIDEVNKLSSYIGRNAKDANMASLYDKIKVKVQDAPLLDKYINEAVNRLTTASREYLETVLLNSGVITLTLPSSFSSSLETELHESAANYVINFTFASWLLYCQMIDDAKYYSTISESNLIDYVDKLYTRDKPKIPTHA